MQDTYEIVTPVAQKKVLLKGWITGREADALNNVMFEGIMVSQEDADNPGNIKIPATKSIIQKNKKIETYVISVDGIKDNVLNLVMDMHQDDTAFISDEIDKIIKKKSE